MALWKEWKNRLGYLLRPRGRTRFDDDLEQEVRFHVDARIAELEADGLTAAEARAQTIREFGSVMRMREESRAAWQFRWLEDFATDLRYAVRTFRRNPGFVVTAVLSLALGIGATSAIVTALDAVIWRPLPVPDPASLVGFTVSSTRGDQTGILPLTFIEQLQAAHVFSDVIGTSADGLSFAYDDRAERIVGEVVTPNYFTALGVQPILGQGFSPAVQRGEWAPEVVLAYDFWQRRFNGDPGVIGRSIHLNTVTFTIVGVSPPGFFGTERGSAYELRLPLMPRDRTLPQMRLISWNERRALRSLARLAPGTTQAQAEAAVDAQMQLYLRTTAPKFFRDFGIRHVRLSPRPAGEDGVPYLRAPLYVLLVLAATVLVIACVNVASLLLARATARSRELAVRLSIGAGRARLIRQMLAESLLLSLIGGIVAVGIANWSAGLMAMFLPQGHISLVLDFHPDQRALLFTATLSVLTAFAFGLLPAFQATRGDLATTLKADSAGAAGGGPHSARVRQALVASQVAFSVVLLIATGMFVRTLSDLRPDDYRADPNRVLLFTLKPQMEVYTQTRKLTMAAELLRRVSQVPGVQSATLAEYGPLGSRTRNDPVQVPGKTLDSQMDWVTPGFFDTVGMPRLAGRDFTVNDKQGSPLVAIVNQSLARALFGDANPLGQRVQVNHDRALRDYEIVGVVADTRYYELHEAPHPSIWFAFQGEEDLYMPTLHVRIASSDTAALVASIRREFDQVDRGFPVFNIKTLEVRIDEAMSRERMIANISATFGGLAVLLAAIGLYGILAYSVTRRTREFGIRIALGSTSRAIIVNVAREGLLLVGVGSVIGLAIAVAGSRLLAAYLAGVSSLSPSIVAVCTGTMVLVTLAAVCVPAARLPRRSADRVAAAVAVADLVPTGGRVAASNRP